MSKDKLAKVFHFDLYGKREEKYNFLNENSLESIEWKKLDTAEPSYFFVEKDFAEISEYERGFKIEQLFISHSVGVVTSKDAILVDENENSLFHKVEKYFGIAPDRKLFKRFSYRVFDEQYLYYDTKLIDRARDKVMQHLLNGNLALITPKQAIKGFHHVFVSKNIADKNFIDSAGQFGAGNVFPLYLYPETNNQLSIGESQTRVPNLNMDIVREIEEQTGLHFAAEKDHQANQAPSPSEKAGDEALFHPIDLLDYIYAVLHSPVYREKYKEFLKIDFPRVPYPTDPKQFFDLVDLGRQIRELHLLESAETEKYITQYPIDGNNVVVKPSFTVISNGERGEISDPQGTEPKILGKVFINETQYFDNVPKTAWEFYIGGYQPAQKWLKDRKGRELSFEDIMHYQKIIVALTKTAELMVEIDGVLVV